MDRELATAVCRELRGAQETHPFGPEDLVFKVGGKMFALVALTGEPAIALKCDPELAEDLRRTFPAVTAAPYLSKRHWNRVRLDGSVPEAEVRGMIRHSYELVVAALPKTVRAALG
jgi:predicted DNA-binding protein (MmcQ/YjbR family)